MLRDADRQGRHAHGLLRAVALLALFVVWTLPSLGSAQEHEVDAATGLVVANGWEQVRAHCSGCHSLSLVRQNSGDTGHWRKLIRWMQAEHGLWDLGPAEAPIVDYLAGHYGAPAVIPRRKPLETNWWEETSQ